MFSFLPTRAYLLEEILDEIMMNQAFIRHRIFEGCPAWWKMSSRSRHTVLTKDAKTDIDGTQLDDGSQADQEQHQHQQQRTSSSAGPSSNTRDNYPLDPPSPPPTEPSHRILSSEEMAEGELRTILKQLHHALSTNNFSSSQRLLSRAKIGLLKLNALLPTHNSSTQHLRLARETLELGALISIRLQDPDSFTRYFQQLQPFYAVPEAALPKAGGNASKITGLYLLLLLSQGDYAAFHTLLETLEIAAAQEGGTLLEEDKFIQYPIRLEQALMEGSYDRVWGETKGERVPSEEFSIFSEVLIGTIRSEIASCSEKAYPSIPISDAKSLLFLDSEGSVVQFAQQRGWTAKDGRIYFPQQEQDLMGSERDILVASGQVIENTLGYARELETIV